MFRCKECNKYFPVVAWIYGKEGWREVPLDSHNELLTKWKPCCPRCHSIEIERLDEKTE